MANIEDRIARVTPDLPSWVPGYAPSSGRDPLVVNDRKHGLLEGGSYQAPGKRSLYLDFPFDEPQHCILLGRPIGKVRDIVDQHYHPDLQPGETGEFIQWLDLTLGMPETYQFRDECRGKALWRTLIANHVNGETPAPEASYNVFRRWLWWQLAKAAWQVFDPSIWRRHIEKLYDLDLLPPPDEIGSLNGELVSRFSQLHFQPGPFKDFSRPFEYNYSWRRLFRTDSGHLGIGGRCVKPGDSVFLIAGAAVPHVLRDLEGGKYERVSEAYIHGIMHGEASTKETEWSKITLR